MGGMGEMMAVQIRVATLEDLPKLLDIYNHEVLCGTATFDTQPWTLERRREWFDAHNVDNHPLLVAVDDDGVVAGYASLSPYRDKDAYAATVELSVYIAADRRGRGLGRALMEAILDLARADERTHVVVSVITAGNEASMHLHEELGFSYSGTLHEVGVKFGRYLDVINYELLV